MDHADFRRAASTVMSSPTRLRVTIPSSSDLPGSWSVCRCAPSALTPADRSGFVRW